MPRLPVARVGPPGAPRICAGAGAGAAVAVIRRRGVVWPVRSWRIRAAPASTMT
ncbi:MAG: hypothetical protein Q4G49_04730 [Paracoccus sp. (in: a-proteobacteria)]|nr:hypothetical protein [Paracoccus sp. (in: a-proteobacteria)]